MRFWRAVQPADVVIDLRERLAPYERAGDVDAQDDDDRAVVSAVLHPSGDEPYRPRHMARR